MSLSPQFPGSKTAAPELDFLPFARPELDAETIAAVVAVLQSGWLASGPQVQAFEAALSDYVGGRPVRVLTSATAALEVALELLGVGLGDEVITPAQSFFATSNMIERVGAKPVFVDVDLITRNIDLAQAGAAITSRTKALMPVHLLAPLPMDALYHLAQKNQLRVVEDAALAIGSSWQGQRIGSLGDIVTFSFHPNKNMTTIEGGAMVLNTTEEAAQVEQLRFHGIRKLPDGTRDVAYPGGKFNLSDVAAAVGLGQLAQLGEFIAKRQQLAEHYFTCFAAYVDELKPLLPPNPPGHSWNMFPVLLPLAQARITREHFMQEMRERKIGIGVSYEALHLSTLSRNRWGYREGMFPNAERIGRETVTLPLFSAMRPVDVERVVAATMQVLRRSIA